MARKTFWLFAIPLTFAFSQAIGFPADSLPDEIPSRSATSKELIEQAARAAARISDFKERYWLVASVLPSIHSVPPDQRQPLAELFERDARQITDDQTLISTRYGIFAASPELALELARGVKGDRLRDLWLSDLVHYHLTRDRAEAENLLKEIKYPSARAEALTWLARDSRSNFAQARSALLEAEQLGWERGGPPAFTYGEVLARFAASQPEEVVELIRSQFSVDDAVTSLCNAAQICRRDRNEPEAAKRLLSAAVELIPSSLAPATPTKTVIRYGYAEQNREHALKLFDAFLKEWNPRQPSPELDEILLALVGADEGTAIANAEQMTERYNSPKKTLFPEVLNRIAVLHGPTQPLKWLQEASPSDLRDRATVRIASGLNVYATTHQLKEGVIQEWVERLSILALQITDPVWQKYACEEIENLANQHKVKAPDSIRKWHTALVSQDHRKDQPYRKDDLALLPLDKQRAEIDATWRQIGEVEGHSKYKIRAAAAVVRDSSLPLDEKRMWFEKLLQAARVIPDPYERAVTLTGLALGLRNIDLEFSLRVHWEELVVARQLGLKPTLHDWIDNLGTFHPLASADEVLEFTLAEIPGTDDRIVSLLWEFARKLENNDERDAVLAALGNLFVKRNDLLHAAGLASLLTDPTRQLRLAAKIAQAQNEK